jgi:hypothetical protein
MSACRIRFFISTGALFFVLLFGGAASGASPEKEPIPSFLLSGPSGAISSETLFWRRRIVLVVTEHACSGIESFLVWRMGLSPDQADQALILCVGGVPEKQDSFMWLAPDLARTALGLTGTPMLLGIEENKVIWRITGFIQRWQLFASHWVEAR